MKWKKLLEFISFLLANKQEFIELYDELVDIINLIKDYITEHKNTKK